MSVNLVDMCCVGHVLQKIRKFNWLMKAKNKWWNKSSHNQMDRWVRSNNETIMRQWEQINYW